MRNHSSHILNNFQIVVIFIVNGAFALLLALSLSGCGEKEKSLPFETIVRGNPSGRSDSIYNDNDLFILNTGQEAYDKKLALWPGRPGSKYESIVDSVDYDKYMTIIAIYGARSTNERSITIESVTQKGKTVNVIIREITKPEESSELLSTLHAIKIKKSNLSTTGNLTFKLVIDGQAILTKEHAVSK